MAALVLTLVLALVWALFIALGYWHGGWREVVALAGILLSYAVLSEWAGPNGRDLSDAFGWNLARTITGVALAYLIGGAAILGYLGSMLLPRPYPIAARERVLGALVGVLNGGLLLALVLRVLRAYTFAPGKGTALNDSALARFLVEEIGYVLIAAFVAGIGAVAVGFILSVRRTAAEEVTSVEGPIEPLPAAPSVHPVSQPMPVPTAPLVALPTATHPYAATPVIDWPAMPPPGLPVTAPIAAAAVAATTSREQPVPARPPAPPPTPPTEPRVPARVPPPMWYPVETLMGAATKDRPAPAGAPRPAEPVGALPPVVITAAATAPSMPPPATPLALPVPTMPPPGALVAQSPSPPMPEAEKQPAEEAVVVRELDVTTRESAPVTVPASDVSTETLDDNTAPTQAVAGEDPSASMPETPLRPPETRAAAPEPSVPVAPAEQTETSDTQTPDIVVAVPPVREEASVAATTAFPTVKPPPLPLVPLPVAGQPDAARQRGSYARVAQPRQPGGQPPLPAPQPPQQPEQEQPLRPPVPTGPDIRPCPTCGYPVRPHTRYCPNCGHRLSR